MDLQVSNEPGYVLARLIGRIDDSAEPPFREKLFPRVGQTGTKVVLDMSAANFISSSGIGLLVRFVAHANTNASRVILAACTPFVAVVIERCKLGNFLEVAKDVPEAAGRLKAT